MWTALSRGQGKGYGVKLMQKSSCLLLSFMLRVKRRGDIALSLEGGILNDWIDAMTDPYCSTVSINVTGRVPGTKGPAH